MPDTLPIEAAKAVADAWDLHQVILLAWDGKNTHVVTYGATDKDSLEAAQGGNAIKQWMRWPDELCQSEPPVLLALRSRIHELETQLAMQK